MSTNYSMKIAPLIFMLYMLLQLVLGALSVDTSKDVAFQFPTSGSFRFSQFSSNMKIVGGHDEGFGSNFGLNQRHEMEWRGIFQLDDRKNSADLKIFAQSLESPLSILLQNEKTFMVIPHNNSCIQIEYGLMSTEFVGGIQKTLSQMYQQIMAPAVKLQNWKESFEMNLHGLAGCSSQDRVFVNLLNQEYSNEALIVCVNQKNYPYRIRSSNVMVEISPVNSQDTKLFEKVKMLSQTCVKHKIAPQMQYQKEMPKTNKKLVWFKEDSNNSILKELEKINLKNNGTKRICVFLHGAGVKNEGVPLNDWPHYWGQVNSFTENLCSERWFIRRNTKENGWTSEYLQTSYCELALIGNKNKTNSKVITNTIVFTHSMANMIFPTAMYKGYCSLDLTTSTWVSLSAPFNGSPAAVYLKTLCYQYVHKTAPHELQKILDFVAEITGSCDGDNPDLADATLLPNYCDPNTTNYHGKKPMCLGDPIFSYSEPKISARLCGSSPFGLVSYYGVALEIFSQMVQYGEPNDGLVPVSSCFMTTDASSFVGNYTSSLYNAAINHSDATCRNGDSMFSEANKMPCAFFGIYRSPVQRK